MKRAWYLLMVTVLAAGLISSCGGGAGGEDDGGGNGDDPPVYDTGTLTVRNQTSFDLELIHWVDGMGNTYFFGVDLIWDPYVGDYVYGLHPGSSYMWEVLPGSSYLFFWTPNTVDFYRTADMVTVNAGQDVVFTFTDETMIYTLDTNQEGIVFDIEDAVRVPADDADRRMQAESAEIQLNEVQ